MFGIFKKRISKKKLKICQVCFFTDTFNGYYCTYCPNKFALPEELNKIRKKDTPQGLDKKDFRRFLKIRLKTIENMIKHRTKL